MSAALLNVARATGRATCAHPYTCPALPSFRPFTSSPSLHVKRRQSPFPFVLPEIDAYGRPRMLTEADVERRRLEKNKHKRKATANNSGFVGALVRDSEREQGMFERVGRSDGRQGTSGRFGSGVGSRFSNDRRDPGMRGANEKRRAVTRERRAGEEGLSDTVPGVASFGLTRSWRSNSSSSDFGLGAGSASRPEYPSRYTSPGARPGPESAPYSRFSSDRFSDAPSDGSAPRMPSPSMSSRYVDRPASYSHDRLSIPRSATAAITAERPSLADADLSARPVPEHASTSSGNDRSRRSASARPQSGSARSDRPPYGEKSTTNTGSEYGFRSRSSFGQDLTSSHCPSLHAGSDKSRRSFSTTSTWRARDESDVGERDDSRGGPGSPSKTPFAPVRGAAAATFRRTPRDGSSSHSSSDLAGYDRRPGAYAGDQDSAAGHTTPRVRSRARQQDHRERGLDDLVSASDSTRGREGFNHMPQDRQRDGMGAGMLDPYQSRLPPSRQVPVRGQGGTSSAFLRPFRNTQSRGNLPPSVAASHPSARGSGPDPTPSPPRDHIGGWAPIKKLTFAGMAGLRALHAADPKLNDRAALSEKFGISYTAVTRILRSKWRDTKAPAVEPAEAEFDLTPGQRAPARAGAARGQRLDQLGRVERPQMDYSPVPAIKRALAQRERRRHGGP